MQAPSRSRSRGLGQVGFLRVRAGGNMSAAIHAPAAGVLTSHAVFLLQGMPTPPDFAASAASSDAAPTGSSVAADGGDGDGVGECGFGAGTGRDSGELKRNSGGGLGW